MRRVDFTASFTTTFLLLAAAAPVEARAASTNSSAASSQSGATAIGASVSNSNSYTNTNKITNTSSKQKNAPDIFGPGLVAGSESCLGSSSVGGSGAGWGFIFGTTTKDEGCNRRLNAKTLATLGYRRAAVQVLCFDPEVFAAMEAAGTRCRVNVSPRQ